MNYKEMINSECKDLIRVVDSQFQLTIRLKKINEQLGEATKGKIDPTNRFTSKIQRKLCKVRKEKKIANKTYFKLFDPIPPRLCGTIKVFLCELLFLQ